MAERKHTRAQEAHKFIPLRLSTLSPEPMSNAKPTRGALRFRHPNQEDLFPAASARRSTDAWDERQAHLQEFTDAFFAIPEWLEQHQMMEFPLMEVCNEKREDIPAHAESARDAPLFQVAFSPYFARFFLLEGSQRAERESPCDWEGVLSNRGARIPLVLQLQQDLKRKRPSNLNPAYLLMELPDERIMVQGKRACKGGDSIVYRTTLFLPEGHELREPTNPAQLTLYASHVPGSSTDVPFQVPNTPYWGLEATTKFLSLPQDADMKELSHGNAALEAVKSYMLSRLFSHGVAPGFPFFMASVMYQREHLMLIQEKLTRTLHDSIADPEITLSWAHFRAQLSQLLYSTLVASHRYDFVQMDWTTKNCMVRMPHRRFEELTATFALGSGSPEGECLVFENLPVGKIGFWCLIDMGLASMKVPTDELRGLLPQGAMQTAVLPPSEDTFVDFSSSGSALSALVSKTGLPEALESLKALALDLATDPIYAFFHSVVDHQELEEKLGQAFDLKDLRGLDHDQWEPALHEVREAAKEGRLKECTFYQCAVRSLLPLLTTYVVSCVDRLRNCKAAPLRFHKEKERAVELLLEMQKLSPGAFALGVVAAWMKELMRRDPEAQGPSFILAYHALVYFFPGFYPESSPWDFVRSMAAERYFMDEEREEEEDGVLPSGNPTYWRGKMNQRAVQDLLRQEPTGTHLVFHYEM